MVLAIAQALIEKGKNPANAMWAQCQDIDRTAALTCFVQLSLWNIPAVVIVGDTLANEVRECFYTPAHHLGAWEYRLWRADLETVGSDDSEGEPISTDTEHVTEVEAPAVAQMRWIF